MIVSAGTGVRPLAALPKLEPKRLADAEQFLTQIIWGPAGCGKTTLAATAPGHKLWLLFDPDGCESIRARDDIYVLDFTGQPDSIVEKFKEGDAFGIKAFLAEHLEVETIVFDSTTTFGEMALRHGCKHANVPAEEPGRKGYGRKNTWVNMTVWNVVRIAKEMKRHVIFLVHEDIPDRDEQGNVTGITMMLGSSLAQQVPIKFSEVWHLSDNGKERKIMIRAGRLRSPMKSRMFVTSAAGEFVWKFNADTLTGDGISTWFDLWKKNGKKIEVPK